MLKNSKFDLREIGGSIEGYERIAQTKRLMALMFHARLEWQTAFLFCVSTIQYLENKSLPYK